MRNMFNHQWPGLCWRRSFSDDLHSHFPLILKMTFFLCFSFLITLLLNQADLLVDSICHSCSTILHIKIDFIRMKYTIILFLREPSSPLPWNYLAPPFLRGFLCSLQGGNCDSAAPNSCTCNPEIWRIRRFLCYFLLLWSLNSLCGIR